jgi:hypothetical protein
LNKISYIEKQVFNGTFTLKNQIGEKILVGEDQVSKFTSIYGSIPAVEKCLKISLQFCRFTTYFSKLQILP